MIAVNRCAAMKQYNTILCIFLFLKRRQMQDSIVADSAEIHRIMSIDPTSSNVTTAVALDKRLKIKSIKKS